VHEVVDGRLPQVVIDPENGSLVEDLAQDLVELPGRGEITPEGLLDDDPTAGEARLRESSDDRGKRARRDGEIEGRASTLSQLLAERVERRSLVVVTAHVAKLAR